MRFRFCLNGLSEAVCCIFPNQTLVENHNRDNKSREWSPERERERDRQTIVQIRRTTKITHTNKKHHKTYERKHPKTAKKQTPKKMRPHLEGLWTMVSESLVFWCLVVFVCLVLGFLCFWVVLVVLFVFCFDFVGLLCFFVFCSWFLYWYLCFFLHIIVWVFCF